MQRWPMKGICGRLVDVDLTSGRTKEIVISAAMARKYLGGRGLGARLLFDLLPPKTGPLSPENILIFLTGPLTGSMVPGSSKFVVVTKSPLTHGWCDSYSSGRISIELKKAGYDGIVIRGKSNFPCYLKIVDRGVEIREADGIWGKDSFAAEKTLKELDGNGSAGVSSIGPAGENLCSYACINSDYYRQAARCGVGAVMGSKRLKAIVVRGSKNVEFHDHKRIIELNRESYQRAKVSQVFQARSKYGTPLTLNFTHKGGILPTKNFQYGTWEKALGKIDSVGVYKSVKSHKACQSCFVHCSLITEAADGKYKGTTVEGPEYETIGMFGSNLLIDSLPTIIQANVLCDKLGLDTISAGNVIGFVMECFEKGLLTGKQTEGLELNFGDDEACLAAIERIAYRKGFGEIMSQGVRAAARQIGGGSDSFAMQVKGLEFPAYDPRGAFGSGLSFAVSPRGACHRRAWPPAKEILGGVPPYTAEGKGAMIRDLYAENCIFHSLLVCDMPAKFIPLTLNDYANYYQAATGEAISQDDFLAMAGRTETLIRMFNNREGFTRVDDTLPQRTLREPLPDGPGKGQCVGEENLNRMIDDFYACQGWDAAGVPTEATLQKYGLANETLNG
ncbi:MAG: aldehyde ferredoxin oxidoreductase [Syntrophobacterales bacterium CG03_land_8_20_14_0_80_58_14]|nr:MAG: aldehyde ferredoxin oxidoreductase [Syntrophobacterales bacterium CG03_land_8_20_14_0_80_58_14]